MGIHKLSLARFAHSQGILVIRHAHFPVEPLHRGQMITGWHHERIWVSEVSEIGWIVGHTNAASDAENMVFFVVHDVQGRRHARSVIVIHVLSLVETWHVVIGTVLLALVGQIPFLGRFRWLESHMESFTVFFGLATSAIGRLVVVDLGNLVDQSVCCYLLNLGQLLTSFTNLVLLNFHSNGSILIFSIERNLSLHFQFFFLLSSSSCSWTILRQLWGTLVWAFEAAFVTFQIAWRHLSDWTCLAVVLNFRRLPCSLVSFINSLWLQSRRHDQIFRGSWLSYVVNDRARSLTRNLWLLLLLMLPRLLVSAQAWSVRVICCAHHLLLDVVVGELGHVHYVVRRQVHLIIVSDGGPIHLRRVLKFTAVGFQQVTLKSNSSELINVIQSMARCESYALFSLVKRTGSGEVAESHISFGLESWQRTRCSEGLHGAWMFVLRRYRRKLGLFQRVANFLD